MTDDAAPSPLEALTEFLYLVPVGLLRLGAGGEVQLINPMAAQLLMASGASEPGLPALEVLSPGLGERLRGFAPDRGVVLDHERCPVRMGGEQRVLALSVHRLDGGAHLAMLDDVTRAVEQERRLFAEQERLRAIFANVRDYAIHTVDLEGRLDEWNPSLQRLGGWRAEDVAGRKLDLFLPLEERTAGRLGELLATAREAGSVESEGWRLGRDGTRRWTNTVLTALPDQAGAVRGFVVVARDMTERKRIEDDLRRLATTDPLTGTFNRRFGLTSLQDAVAAAALDGTEVAVLMLDVDHFKSVNDRHGHDVGDLALRSVAATCLGVIGDAGLTVRWGGEEFLVILPCAGPDAGMAVAERLRFAIAEAEIMLPRGKVALRVTASIGVMAGRGVAAEALIQRADEALYAAKRAGRDRVAAWRPPLAAD